MDLSASTKPIVHAMRAEGRVEVRGSRTHASLGFPVSSEARSLTVSSGIVRHDPADLTVTALAGTSVAELDAALASSGQFVPLDPVDTSATLGGTIASGLSGLRRLGFGPLRDHVLEIRFVDAHGSVLRAGGPTVKNVTGYDLVRLLVGSLGTLGVFVSVTLRCRPTPPARHWWTTSSTPRAVLVEAFGVVAVLSDREHTYVRFEGEPADADVIVSRLADVVEIDRVAAPNGACRGRISVAPRDLPSVTDAVAALSATDVLWLAEWGIGTVHIACADESRLAEARAIAHRHGGWLLREAGAPGLDPFGVAPANLDLMRRVKGALDPEDRLAPGRFG